MYPQKFTRPSSAPARLHPGRGRASTDRFRLASHGRSWLGVPCRCVDIVSPMHAQQAFDIRPGQRLRVTRQIPRGSGALVNILEGVVVRVGQQKTGSWYAHSQDKKLWLDRVELRKDDGELVVCNLDHLSVIENLDTQAH